MTAARVSHTSQRAIAGDRKVVFKSGLDNPFNVQWPYIPHNLQKTTLACLNTILAGVGKYHLERRTAALKRKRTRRSIERKQKVGRAKKRKVGDEGDATTVGNDVGTTLQDTLKQGNHVMELDTEADIELPPAPPIVAHLTIGINEVTKRLESQAHSRCLRTSIYASTSEPTEISASAAKLEPGRAPLAYVFVCRADIDPPLLVAHLPELVASCNAPLPCLKSPPVHLITLPKQAESTLAETVGLRRVSILALDSAAPSLAMLSSLLADIQPPSAAWLTGPSPHIPTHIKQLRTSAPRDMRTAKQTRTEGRRAAKEKNKLNFRTTIKGRRKDKNFDGLVKAVTKVKVKSLKRRIKVVLSTTTPAHDLLST